MQSNLFERLLYEEESTTLEFKREQYRFANSTEIDKSELLKDILGFANAWRRSEAYILIGVEDSRGGRGNVVGVPVTGHLDDHSLQQFVNSLTNQPVRFHYEAFGFEGKQVGIITIEEHTRPIYLKRDYGKLVKEKVYVRRGSATDPTTPASPDEIAQMRLGSSHSAADIQVEFADIERDDTLGVSIAWNTEFCKMPATDTIPDLSPPQRSGSFNFPDLSVLSASQPNQDFFRNLAEFELKRRFFRKVRLVAHNGGHVAAKRVRVELTAATDAGVSVIDESALPDPPKKRVGYLSDSLMMSVRPVFRREGGELTINENSERFRIDIDFRDLQPGRRVWSDTFCIGKTTSGDLVLHGVIFADNLPQPKDFVLTASVTVTQTSMTVDELCSLGRRRGRNE